MKAPKQGIQLKQSQKLTLTPQLTHSLKILQCNQQDLEIEIKHMLENNIMLERPSEAENWEIDLASELPSESQEKTSLDEDIPQEVDADITWDDYYDDDIISHSSESEGFQDSWVADVESFDERLEQAIYQSPLSAEQQQLSNKILTYLDDNYFLSKTPEDLSKILQVEIAEITYVIDVIKHLDPAGVASQNIQECLLAQLHSQNNQSETAVNAHEILSEYFSYIDQKPKIIIRRLGISEHEYDQAIAMIAQFTPYPRTTNERLGEPIKPDIYVRKRMGMYYASLNKDARFDVAINATYASLTKSCQGDEKQFIQAQLAQAKAFLASIDQRQKTILRVTNAIIMHQQDYFIEGDKAMRPLKMQDIAEMLKLNESTISRTISGKFLCFNHKLIALKHFFSQNLSTTITGQNTLNSDAVNSTAVAAKALIKELIAEESAHKPLSDSKIEQQLKEKSINISRRTVAKYREALGIASTSQRKIKK